MAQEIKIDERIRKYYNLKKTEKMFWWQKSQKDLRAKQQE
jgi:hypothetical protein